MWCSIASVDHESRREQGLTPLLATAVSLHEWFTALLEAGFSEDQAMKLIVQAMVSNPGDSE